MLLRIPALTRISNGNAVAVAFCRTSSQFTKETWVLCGVAPGAAPTTDAAHLMLRFCMGCVCEVSGVQRWCNVPGVKKSGKAHVLLT
jgi:hypothetical protein